MNEETNPVEEQTEETTFTDTETLIRMPEDMPDFTDNTEQPTVTSVNALITDTRLKEGVSPLQIESIAVVVNFNKGATDYFGGQVLLTADDDGITFTTSTDTIKSQAIAKAKRLIADAQI